jgi:hypothetical protein
VEQLEMEEQLVKYPHFSQYLLDTLLLYFQPLPSLFVYSYTLRLISLFNQQEFATYDEPAFVLKARLEFASIH